MDTTYGNSGVTTRTSGAPQIQLPDNSEMMRLAYEIARQRMAQQQQAASPRMAPMTAQRQAPTYAPSNPNVWGSGPTGIDAELEGMQKRQAIMDLEQAGRPAPQRMMHGAGINPGYVTNPNAMDASQRRDFLPQSSQMTAAPGFSSGAEGRAIDPLSDPYSDQYRSLIAQGFSPGEIATLRRK